MTPEQLTKIIKIANKGGWKGLPYQPINADDIQEIYSVGEDGCWIIGEWKDETRMSFRFHLNEIIFDPGFGEGYWNQHDVCACCGGITPTRDFYSNSICHHCDVKADVLPVFKYHQSKLGGMSTREREEYMVKDLGGKK